MLEKEELKERIENVLGKDVLEPATAESLRSRLLFVDSQIYGRFSKMALHKIGSVANARNPECPLSAEVRRAFEWFIHHVLSGPPRVISCDSCETFHLFLDGVCSEPSPKDAWSATSVGAVLANDKGQIIRFFGHVVDNSLVKTWSSESQVQHVFEAEVLRYPLCLAVWQHILNGQVHLCIH